jgi:hypothetical protein
VRREQKREVAIFGCNLGHRFTVGRKLVNLTINVQIPYMPITSNGKEPDLRAFLIDLREVVEKAASKCQRVNRTGPAERSGILPSLSKGRPNDEKKARYAAELADFAARLKEINSRLDFKSSSRGWCYILENEHQLSKGDFAKAEGLIADCRKNGLLPIDFTAEDGARAADNLEMLDDPDAAQHAANLARGLGQWNRYAPVSFWDFQPVYIQMVVEKIDLKSLFNPICQEYRVPIINSRGWSDLNLRAGLMRRFQEHERKGQKPVLLTCGDHDPVGLLITEQYRTKLEELETALGWSPQGLMIERFGLNSDFIETHGLTWIDGLKTGSGMDLADANHKQHNADFVQEYIAQFGARKVEANALVVRAQAGRLLCREAIEKYLDMSGIARYHESLVMHRRRAQAAMPQAVQEMLEELWRTDH